MLPLDFNQSHYLFTNIIATSNYYYDEFRKSNVTFMKDRET
jgi:hypothetical protein